MLDAVRVRVRRQKVRQMMLHGYCSQDDMAARLCISQTTIYKDMQFIRRNWIKEDAAETKYMRARSTRQFLMSASKAMTAFEESRQPEEQVTITRTPHSCRACRGGGFRLEDGGESTSDWCSECDGEGKVFVEVESRKVTRQVGDASFLNTYNKSIENVARIHDLYPRKEAKGPKVKELHLHAESGGNGKVDLSKLPRKLMFKLLEIQGEIKEHQKQTNVLTVESEEVEDQGKSNGEDDA